MKKHLAFSLLGIALSVSFVAGAMADGAADYTAKCATCHGADGKGNAKMEQMLKVKIPALAGSALKPDAELLKLVSEGKKPMPSFAKSLSKDEIDAVVQYAKELATGKVAGGK